MKNVFLLIFLNISYIAISQLRTVNDNVYNPTVVKEAIPLYNAGTNAIESRNYKLAIQKFRKVILLDPNFTDCYDNLAICYRRIEKLDSAIYYYKISLKIFPKNRLALNNLGLTYLDKNQFKDAEITYRQSLKLNSNSIETNESEIELNGEPYYGLCRTYFYQKKYDLAINNGETAYKIWESKLPLYASDALFIVGLSYLNKGDKINGLNKIKKSAKMENENAIEFLKKNK
jgi:tetratricopeptide (TPR) repeat protein